MKPFLQNSKDQSTIENWKTILKDNQFSIFGLFAYITDSGVAQLYTSLGELIGKTRHCRWIFGFDYARSQPTAIRKLVNIGQNEIRIFDANYVLQSEGLIPRRSFHLKTMLTLEENGYPKHQIIGSGNLSASGLLSGIEAGCLLNYNDLNSSIGKKNISDLEEIWKNATPIENVIDEYERLYTKISQPKISAQTSNRYENKIFWIDVGYVTKNRGADKPGNQFDLPKGSHVFLGLKENSTYEKNSVLGSLNFKTPVGTIVTRTLRFGNNSMEKVTLPIPEKNGIQTYDGKILTFKNKNNLIEIEAFEHDDFQRVYGNQINSYETMQSGRSYGTIMKN